MELEGVRHGEDRQGRNFQLHQPCHLVCLPRIPDILPWSLLERLPDGRT